MDVHSKQIRSYNMSRIRNKDSKPEMIVRRYLFINGFRYRLHPKGLPGKPDIILKKYNTAIFVNGCFWHGHEGCKYFKIPKTRTRWWLNKINNNIDRDKKVYRELKNEGWNILVVWECQLIPKLRDEYLKSLSAQIYHNNK